MQFYKVTELQHPTVVAYCNNSFAAAVRYFIAVLIIFCVIGVEYLRLMQCYKAAKLQHQAASVYQCYLFSADLIPMVSYFVAAFIICYI